MRQRIAELPYTWAVPLSGPKGESNGAHQAHLHTGGVLATRPQTPSCGILLVGIAVYGRVTVAHVFWPHIATHALLRMACHMRLVRMLMVMVVPLALALGGAWLYAWHWYTAPGPLTEEKTVLIRRAWDSGVGSWWIPGS